MTIYKVFDKDKQQYWSGRPYMEFDEWSKAKRFDNLTDVLNHLDDMRKGSDWSKRSPQTIPSSWVIIEYELKEVHHFNAKEYAEAR